MELNPLNQIHGVTIVGMIVVFWVTFVLMKVLVFNPVLDVMIARRRKIAEGEAKLAEADSVLNAAREEADSLVADGEAQAETVQKEATEVAESRRQERLVAAKEEADALLSQGRAGVADIRAQEAAKVREELVGCTGIACRKLIGKVDDRLVASIVDKVMRARLAA